MSLVDLEYFKLWVKLLDCVMHRYNDWNRIWADQRRGLNSLNSASEVRTCVLFGSSIDLHLLQTYGLYLFLFDIPWWINSTFLTSLQGSNITSAHIGYRDQVFKINIYSKVPGFIRVFYSIALQLKLVRNS